MKELYKRVAELDNPERRIADLAPTIAEQLGAHEETVKAYLGYSRKGFQSIKDYFDTKAQERGFKNRLDRQVQSKGFKRPIEYFNYRAKQRGYKSWADYLNARAKAMGFKDRVQYTQIKQREKRKRLGYDPVRRKKNKKAQEAGFKNYEEQRAKETGYGSTAAYQNARAQQRGYKTYIEYTEALRQKKFEKGIKRARPRQLASIAADNEQEHYELQELFETLSVCLTKDERTLLEARYSEGRTLREIGKESGVSGELIRQKIAGVVEKLRKKYIGALEIELKSPEKRKHEIVEEGERLLVHIAGKAADAAGIMRGKTKFIKTLYEACWPEKPNNPKRIHQILNRKNLETHLTKRE